MIEESIEQIKDSLKMLEQLAAEQNAMLDAFFTANGSIVVPDTTDAKPKDDSKKPAAKKDKPKPEAKAEEPAAEEPETPELTTDDVREALLKLDRDQSKALLGDYNARKLSELDASEYSNIIAAAEKLVDEDPLA